MSQTSSDKLDSIGNKQSGDKNSSLKNNRSRDSIILAGSLATQQCTSVSDSCNTDKNYNMAYNNRLYPLSKNISIVSDETSYLSIKPDLNKCINLFHNEHLNKEYDSCGELSTTLSETTVREDINSHHLNKNKTTRQRNLGNRPRSMSTDSLRNIILFNQKLKKSKSYTTLRALKRDMNYNIKDDQLFFSTKTAKKINQKIETIVPSFDALLLSKSALSSKNDEFHSMEEDQRQDSINIETSSKDELDPSELKTFLHSLAGQEPLKEAAVRQRLLRRFSANYHNAPKVFTEGLLTIIEESVINNTASQYPEVSLCRFNEELQKMCKFIEDETIPEWPQSPGMSTSIYARRKSQEPKSDLSRKSLRAFASPDKNLYLSMPVSPRCIVKSPRRIYCMSKNTSYTAKNLLHDSTSTFESLEALCKRLYPDDYNTLPAREKNRLESPLQNMDNIRLLCESQMASLQNSPNIHEQIKKAETCVSDLTCQHNKTSEAEQNLQYRLLSNEKFDRADSKTVFELDKCQETIELDDLESTLMYEIAKKRQRCFDTAKVMMEINANLESMEETYSNSLTDESLSIKNDDKFMETLMCVKKYQDYLEKSKNLLHLFHRARLSSPRTPRTPRTSRTRDRKDFQAKMSNENFKTYTLSILGNKSTLRVPKLSPRKKSTSPSSKHCSASKTVVSKPRLFVTPGKISSNKKCKSKRTYFPNLLPETNKPDISPQAKSIYPQIGNYDHVVSPVGMYIKGIESRLIKNSRSKTETLSVPKRKTTRSPSPKMKFRLSPKRSKEVNRALIKI